MGRPLAVTRYGVVDSDGESETFGLLDKFTLDYDGPLLSSVTSRSDEVEVPTSMAAPVCSRASRKFQPLTPSMPTEGSKETGRRDTHTIIHRPALCRRYTTRICSPLAAIGIYHLRCRRAPYRAVADTRNGGRFATLSYRRYVGPFTFNTDTLERVDFPGLFRRPWQSAFSAHRLAGQRGYGCRQRWNDKQHNTYYPYGEPHREPSGQRRLFAGKERQDYVASGTSDFGPGATSHHFHFGAPAIRMPPTMHPSRPMCSAGLIRLKISTRAGMI